MVSARPVSNLRNVITQTMRIDFLSVVLVGFDTVLVMINASIHWLAAISACSVRVFPEPLSQTAFL